MSIRNSKMGIVLARDTGARGGGEKGDGSGGGTGGDDRRYAGWRSVVPGRKTPSGSFLRLRGVSPPVVERKLPRPSPPRRTPSPPPPACLPARWGGRPTVCLSVRPPCLGVPSLLPAPMCVPAGDGPGSPPHPRCREWGPGSWRREEWAEGRLALGLLGEVSGTPSAPRRCHHFLSPSRY